MKIIIKHNNHLEDTKRSVQFTNPNVQNVYKERYLFLKYYFASQ